jgi:dienelactone hydrolase
LKPVRICKPLLQFFAIILISFSFNGYVFGAPSVGNLVAGKLLEYSLIKSFPAEELKAFFKKHQIPKIVLPVNVGLNVYEVIYTTTYSDNSIVKASGLLYVPINSPKESPVMIYNHGTEICRQFSCDFTGEQSICLAFAADGYIVLTPDYISLGKGERTQLYLNSKAESGASVDMLIAVQDVLPQLNVKVSKQLFVTGYSQGGHAAMATTRLLQQQYVNRFPVTASAPMSGPYNIAQTAFDGRNQRYDYPVFFFLLLQSYYESIGKPKEIGTALLAPYDTLIPPLLDGESTIEDVDKLLPDTIFKAAKPEFLYQFIHDSTTGFRAYLIQNNVFDWKPEMPMQLCYCNGDEEVNYHNSINAYDAMKRNGSASVELWRAGKKFGHENCALFAVIYTKMFFDGFRDGHPGNHGPAFKRLLLEIGKLTVKAR